MHRKYKYINQTFYIFPKAWATVTLIMSKIQTSKNFIFAISQKNAHFEVKQAGDLNEKLNDGRQNELITTIPTNITVKILSECTSVR